MARMQVGSRGTGVAIGGEGGEDEYMMWESWIMSVVVGDGEGVGLLF
jgi:hypothetical protein